MGYRYIAWMRVADGSTDGASTVEQPLGGVDLQRGPTVGAMQLFVARDTPTLVLADGAIVIGHLFTRSGARVLDGSQVPLDTGSAQPFNRLLDEFWGEYLIFLPTAGQDSGVAVMRDPSGGVACIYGALQDGSTFITSDIPLAESCGLTRRVDWDYIERSLSYPLLSTVRTGLAGVSVLLPGCVLQLSAGKTYAKQCWSPWTFVSRDHRYSDHEEAAFELERAVVSAVKAWVEVDASILLELSGGLDSSIVGTCLRGTSARVACCTLLTPTPGADERQYASLIADHLGVDLQTAVLEFEQARFSFVPPCDTVSPRIGALQYAIDSTMMAAADRNDATSFFSGSGGDTVFCYLTNAAPAADALLERGVAAGFSAVRNLSTLHQCTLWTAARLTLKKLLCPPKPARVPFSTFIEPSIMVGPPEDHPWFQAPEQALPGDRERIAGLVDTIVFRETACRAARRWRRMPLLAQPVVETCLRTPSWMWITGGENRAVARAAFAKSLPSDIFNRRSKGNFVNYLGAVFQRNRLGIRDFLFSGMLQQRQLLNATGLERFFAREDLPMRDGTFLEILDLCTVENWLRHQSRTQ